MERIQTSFIKKMTCLAPQTAGYVIRLEFGRGQIQANIFKRALRFWSKMAQLNNKRLPKICILDALKHYDSSPKHSWLFDMETRFRSVGISLTLAYSLASNNQLDENYFMMKYRDQLYRDDLLKLKMTHTYGSLKQLYSEDYRSDYLYRQLNIKLKRTLLRLRIESKI